MQTIIPRSFSIRIKLLCASDAIARRLFLWASQRTNNSRSTSVDRIMNVCSINRPRALELLRKLNDLEIGDLKKGRWPSKTRIEWRFNLIEIGKEAQVA